MSMTLNKLIAHHGQFRANHTAVICGDERLNWKAFSDEVNQLGNALLRAGVSKGDRVATVLPNCPEQLKLYWAVTSIGAVLVPMSPLLQANGLINLLNDSGSRFVFAKEAVFELLEDNKAQINNLLEMRYVIVGDKQHTNSQPTYTEFVSDVSNNPLNIDCAPDDLFNIVYSSGTTGQPKGIQHTHLIRSFYGSLFANSFRITPESKILQTGSIVFNGAFVTLMPAFFQGATYILHESFDVEGMLRTIKEEKVTHTMMVPAQIAAILESPNCTAETLESLEMILTLGAPLDASYKQRMNEIAPGRFYELYGLTEGFVTILDKHDFDAKPHSVGYPPVGYECKIIDAKGDTLGPDLIGEIIGRGPILMSGYYGRDDLTRDAIVDGWLHTGDLGYLDEDGFLHLSGRKKEMIISGGVNVFPVDIEAIILQHPDVLKVAVFGMESEKWGETPVAAVVLRSGTMTTADELKDWVNERVEAKYQRVSDVAIMDDLPANVAGKVVKNTLKQKYLDSRQG